jgi:hypothetical protein
MTHVHKRMGAAPLANNDILLFLIYFYNTLSLRFEQRSMTDLLSSTEELV